MLTCLPVTGTPIPTPLVEILLPIPLPFILVFFVSTKEKVRPKEDAKSVSETGVGCGALRVAVRKIFVVLSQILDRGVPFEFVARVAVGIAFSSCYRTVVSLRQAPINHNTVNRCQNPERGTQQQGQECSAPVRLRLVGGSDGPVIVAAVVSIALVHGSCISAAVTTIGIIVLIVVNVAVAVSIDDERWMRPGTLSTGNVAIVETSGGRVDRRRPSPWKGRGSSFGGRSDER